MLVYAFLALVFLFVWLPWFIGIIDDFAVSFANQATKDKSKK